MTLWRFSLNRGSSFHSRRRDGLGVSANINKASTPVGPRWNLTGRPTQLAPTPHLPSSKPSLTNLGPISRLSSLPASPTSWRSGCNSTCAKRCISVRCLPLPPHLEPSIPGSALYSAQRPASWSLPVFPSAGARVVHFRCADRGGIEPAWLLLEQIRICTAAAVTRRGRLQPRKYLTREVLSAPWE